MCESGFRAAGLKTRLFTSPHLIHVTERIRICGQEVSQETFTKHFWDVWETLLHQEEPILEAPEMPGYFRLLTLLALRIFSEQNLDVVILEVGLGGRMDATNIIPRPAVCGITSLG